MLYRLKGFYEWVHEHYPLYAKIGRYLISGGTATATNLAVLFVLTDFFGVWYLASAVVSYIVSFVVSFTLQKFWTFKDRSREGMHVQAGAYFIMGICNLVLNTLLIFLMVEYAHLHYLLAQFISSAFIALESYFLYQLLIFRKPTL